MKIRNSAFTLAEVLITLAIIGVVAAITIPALMNNIQDAQYKTAYKKAFSIANQAWQQCVTNNELVERTKWQDNAANNSNFLAFKSKFKVMVDCNNGDSTKCWTNADQYWNKPTNETSAFIDSSGMAWSNEANNSGGGNILVDTNGSKAPNQFGKDRFPIAPIVPNPTNSGNVAGIPTKLIPDKDYPNIDTNACLHGRCYYKSWLTQ